MDYRVRVCRILNHIVPVGTDRRVPRATMDHATSPTTVHIHQNACLLIEPKVMGLPGLRRILQREAELLQNEEYKLVYLAQGNLQSTAQVSECSWR
jgi:hypothetical protein